MFRKLVVPLCVSALFVAFLLVLSGAIDPEYAGIASLIDAPSLVLSVLVPFILVSVSFGLTKTKRSFSAPFDRLADSVSLKTARAFFKNLLRSIVAWSILAITTGIIVLLISFSREASSQIGVNVAICLLSAFYASLIPLFLVFPFLTVIDERLAELE